MFTRWWLAKDSDSCIIEAYPAELTGIRKYKGCCLYRPTHDSNGITVFSKYEFYWGLRIRDRICDEIFGHYPKKGELLYVEKTRKGWKAEKIELEFS